MEMATLSYPSQPPVSVPFIGPPLLRDLHSLCPVCGDLKIKKYKALCRRASEGCPWCSLLRTVASKLVGEHLEHSIQLLEVVLPVGDRVEEDRPLLLRLTMSDGAKRSIELFRQQPDSARSYDGLEACAARGWLPPISVARCVSNHSASAECLGLARQWLNNCLENHTECPGYQQVELPTRVLYVGADSITSGPQLVITNGTRRGSYIALSHRWSADMPMRLTADIMHVWQSGIPIESLPKTFRDAVAITRALEVDYLWIDSLCILQDSQEDWASESSRMADIYTNAVLAIAADCSEGGSIFADRTQDETNAAVALKLATTSCPGCSDCTFFARWERARSYPATSHSVVGHGTTAPLVPLGLHSRGWTLQERLLAHRVLHFTPSELAWECTKEVACECRPQGTVPRQYLIFRRAFVNSLPVTQLDAAAALKQIHGPLYNEGGGDLSSIIQLHWWLVVFEFTARSLTIETDRLTALAGIADLLCRRTGQAYFFGVLSNHAVRGLLWRTRRHTDRGRLRPSRRLPPEYAPSWSFGSITGRVGSEPNPERFTLLREAVKVHEFARGRMISEGNAYYGPGRGRVDVEGWMVSVRIVGLLAVEGGYPGKRHAPMAARKLGRVLFTVEGVDGRDHDVKDEGLLSATDEPSKVITSRRGRKKAAAAATAPWGYFEPDVDEYESEVDRTMSTYLLIMGWYEAAGDGRGQVQTVGLILVETARPADDDDGSHACFRRLGIFVGGVGFGEPKISKWVKFGENKRVYLV